MNLLTKSLLLLTLLPLTAHAQLAPASKEIPLYSGPAPGSESWTWSERNTGSPTDPSVVNVVHPVLLYYPADKTKAVGTAIIIAPGGGFSSLKTSYEGVDVAKHFNDLGVSAFVIKYRLKYSPSRGETTPPAGADLTKEQITALATADCQQAIRILREHATDYDIAKNRLGLIAYSAGGAAANGAIRGPADTRPDFAALIYGSSLTGDVPPKDAPATKLFLAVAADDQSVGIQGSLDMFAAWRKTNIPVELHIFQTGAHGFRTKGGGADHYLDRLDEWMKLNTYLTK